MLRFATFAFVSTTIITFIHLTTPGFASSGDKSWRFYNCLVKCERFNCSAEAEHKNEIGIFDWDCFSECKYICMWETVDGFQKDGSRIPQFYGKWPFSRLFGMQEPASVFFSVLNGLSHLIMIIYFHLRIPSKAPMYYIWHIYALVALNAWSCSVVFHSRDTDITEMLDYFSAFSLVLFSFFSLIVRFQESRGRRYWLTGVVASAFLSFYVYHVYYLAFVNFDYGYNMQVNLTVGCLNGFGWLFWSTRVYARQPYVWKAVVSIISVLLLILLELGDFPPLFWVIDAHSLWHAGTSPVAFLWYRFLVDDCNYMLEKIDYEGRETLPLVNETDANEITANDKTKNKEI